MSKSIVLFDAFGTLFDLQIDITSLERFCGSQSSQLLELWRIKQLEYTWLMQAMGRYENFRKVSEMALKNMIQKLELTDNEENILQLLLPIYESPKSFNDVLPALAKLKSLGVESYILSNGTNDMLSQGIKNSGLASSITGYISVDEIKQYKPSPVVYEYALNKLNCTTEDALFVSSNQWDVAGASLAGLDALWLNRKKNSFENLNHTPYAIMDSISELVKYLD